MHGDAFQQHDSRLQEGANLQYLHLHKPSGITASFTSGINFHDNRINVGLYPREGRLPTGVTTRANAHVTNEAAYFQETLSLWNDRLILSGGLRYDEFRYAVQDRVNPDASGSKYAGRWQSKGSAAVTPMKTVPLTLTLNYGRGINSIDARGVVQRPDQPRLATTDFYQFGASLNHDASASARIRFLSITPRSKCIFRTTAASSSKDRAALTAMKRKHPSNLLGMCR